MWKRLPLLSGGLAILLSLAPRELQQLGRAFGLGLIELHDLEARRAGPDTGARRADRREIALRLTEMRRELPEALDEKSQVAEKPAEVDLHGARHRHASFAGRFGTQPFDAPIGRWQCQFSNQAGSNWSVIVRDMPFQAEAIKQRLLHHTPFAHHRESPRFIEKTESEPSPRRKRLFQHNPSKPAVAGNGRLPDFHCKPGSDCSSGSVCSERPGPWSSSRVFGCSVSPCELLARAELENRDFESDHLRGLEQRVHRQDRELAAPGRWPSSASTVTVSTSPAGSPWAVIGRRPYVRRQRALVPSSDRRGRRRRRRGLWGQTRALSCRPRPRRCGPYGMD